MFLYDKTCNYLLGEDIDMIEIYDLYLYSYHLFITITIVVFIVLLLMVVVRILLMMVQVQFKYNQMVNDVNNKSIKVMQDIFKKLEVGGKKSLDEMENLQIKEFLARKCIVRCK